MKTELGGLARSIDALFSRPVVIPEAEAPVGRDPEPDPVEPDYMEPDAVEPDPFEPDPFEPMEAHVADWDTPRTPEPDVANQEAVALGEAPLDASDGDLDEAIAAFVAGIPGAGDNVRSLAAKLKERLALDPLADAVERLVHTGGDSPDQEALDLAQDVINPAVASRLVQRMGHAEEDEARARYVVLSQRLGMVMAKAFRGALTDSTDQRTRRAYYDGLLAMGETSRPVIEGMVEDENRFLVRNAVALLGEVGGERAAGLVTSALANTDARVRCEALGSLAKLGGDESHQFVLASLEDSDAKVRAAAAEAAGVLGVERALKPILGLLEQEDDPSILVALLRGLGRLGDPGAVQSIEKRAVTSMFSRPPTEVRVAAFRALHDIGTPHARELIHEARDDKDAVVRTTVRGLVAPS
jgi:hypothetical protein